MTDWEDVEPQRSAREYSYSKDRMVVTRRQRRLKDDGSYEFRWKELGA